MPNRQFGMQELIQHSRSVVVTGAYSGQGTYMTIWAWCWRRNPIHPMQAAQ